MIKEISQLLPANLFVSCLLLEYKSKYLLLKRTKDNKYSLPGGKLKFNEHFYQALIREINEETNVNINKLNKNKILNFIDNKLFYYSLGNPNEKDKVSPHTNQRNFIFIINVYYFKSNKLIIPKLNNENKEYIYTNDLVGLRKIDSLDFIINSFIK